MKVLILVLGLMFVLFGVPSLWAEESQEAVEPTASEAVETVAFVDLDGDGLSDNLPDDNGDGIPEPQAETQAEPTAAAAGLAESTVEVSAFDIGPLRSTTLEDVLPCSQKFSAYKFATRAICQTRGGLDAGEGFGAGSGIGLGAIKGCPGGVCRPH